MDHVKFHYPSIQSPLSAASLLNPSNFIHVQNRTCVDDNGYFCCDKPFIWKVIATFKAKEDAQRFLQFISSDLTAYVSANQPDELDRPRFLLPLMKGKQHGLKHAERHNKSLCTHKNCPS